MSLDNSSITAQFGAKHNLSRNVSPLPVTGVYIFLYSVVFVLAFVGNIMVILTCYIKHRRATTSILLCYISSLASADLLITLLTTIDLVSLVLGNWPGGNALCKIQGFLLETSYSVSILTVAAISYERSRSLGMTTLARNQPPERRINIIKGVWIAAIFFCIPLLYGYNTVASEDGKEWCLNGENWGRLGRKVYYTAKSFTTFFAPLILMIWAHVKILRVIYTHNRHSTVTSLESRQPKIAKLLMMNTLVFFCCWFPNIVVRLLNCYSVYENKTVWTLAQLFAFANSAFNPILYCFYGSHFRMSLKNAVKNMCRCRLHNDGHDHRLLPTLAPKATKLSKVKIRVEYIGKLKNPCCKITLL